MSYILDALTRSQKQRERSSIPTLTTEDYPVAESKLSIAYPWQGMTVGLASIAVIVALYAISARSLVPVAQREHRPAQPPVSPASATHAAGAMTEPVVHLPRADAGETAPSLTTAKPETDRIEHETPKATGDGAREAVEHKSPAKVANAAQATTSIRSEPAAAPAKSPQVSPERQLKPESRWLVETLLALRDEANHEAPPAQAPSDARQTMQAVPGVDVTPRPAHDDNSRALGAPTANASALPTLRELPLETRQAITPLAINVHAYAQASEQRMVMINMNRYAEGDRLREGPLIDAITPTGVVLTFKNQRFQLKAR